MKIRTKKYVFLIHIFLFDFIKNRLQLNGKNETISWKKWDRKKLKSKKSQVLDTKNLNDKYDTIADTRKELLEVQIKNLKNDNDMKQKEHEFNMQLLEMKKNILEKEEQRNKEEHELRKLKLELEIKKLSSEL